VYTSLRTVQTHLCLCAKYCGVSRYFSADRTDTSVFVREVLRCFTVLLCGPYRHICVRARSTAVFHGVYGRSPLLTTSLFWHYRRVCIFLPYFPGSFLSRTPRVNMSNNDNANGYNALKVSKFDHSSTTPRATRWREWVVKLRYAFGSAYPLLANQTSEVLDPLDY